MAGITKIIGSAQSGLSLCYGPRVNRGSAVTLKKKDFFISYARADSDWAKWIAWQIEDVGYTTFLQAWDFQPGNNFPHKMEKGVTECARTVAVLSPAYFASGFTRAEWYAAFAKDPTGEHGLLLPVRIAEFNVEGLLGQIIYVNLVGVNEKEARERLLTSIEQTRAKPPRPPKFPASPTCSEIIPPTPPTHVVSTWPAGKSGCYHTISEAVAAARSGDRILVYPDRYPETLVIEKSIEIIGHGEAKDVVIESREASVIVFAATMGRISNLTIRQLGDNFYGVDITAGRLTLEDCEISSGLACIAIHNGANPWLRRNDIYNGRAAGIFVYAGGLGTLEDNNIQGNVTGVQINEGSDPILRHNAIHAGKDDGVVISKSKGTLDSNNIFNNARGGVLIKDRSDPVLRGNNVHANGHSGIMVDNANGLLEYNNIHDNCHLGVVISNRGNPVLRHNQIHHGKHDGVMIWKAGEGRLDDNDIIDNLCSGMLVKEGGNPVGRGNLIARNKEWGVCIEDGGGTFENNRLLNNRRGPWYISKNSEANVKRVHNQE